jgi:mRNA interferase MazF
MSRGEVYRLAPPPGGDPKRSRCYVVVSRQTLLDSRAANVICAPVHLVLIEKGRLTNHVGSLAPMKLRALRHALRVALDVE